MDESRIRGSPGRGLASATLGFFVGFAGVVSYGPVASEFEGAMGLSGLALGLLVAAPQLSGSLLRIPFGAWVDDAGAKKPFLVLLALSLVGMAGLSAILVTAYPDGLTMELYPLVFFFGALSGCGIATFSVGSTQTSDWFPREKQGGVLAIYAGLGNTSPALFTLLLPVALAALGLTRAYLAWFAFLAVGTVVYAILAVDPPSFQLRERGLDAEAARERAGGEHGAGDPADCRDRPTHREDPYVGKLPHADPVNLDRQRRQDNQQHDGERLPDERTRARLNSREGSVNGAHSLSSWPAVAR